MLVAVVAACGDKKKKEGAKPEAPKFAGVEALVKNADSLVNLSEATLVGKLEVCPVSGKTILAGRHGQMIVVNGNVADSLKGAMVAVSGKISADTLTQEAVDQMTAAMAECKKSCEKEGKECCKDGKKACGKEGKECCKDGKKACEKEGKEGCCKMPKVGDKIYSIAVSKIEKMQCPKEGCCKEGKKGCDKEAKAGCGKECGKSCDKACEKTCDKKACDKK